MPVPKPKSRGRPTRKRKVAAHATVRGGDVAAAPTAYRSGYERSIATSLTKQGVSIRYEEDRFSFYVPETGRKCTGCGESKIERRSSYQPDFKLREKAYIEAKGKLTAANRKRLEAFKRHYPDVEIYMIFQRDNWMTKNHKAKYSDWASKEGFQWAVGTDVPKGWLKC